MISLPGLLRPRVFVRLAGIACLVLPPLTATAQRPAAANQPIPTPPPEANPATFATPPNPPNGYWTDHFRHNVDRTKRGGVDLLFDGDSITDFWGGAGKEVWAKNYGRVNAVNYGISGDHVENMLWRVNNGEAANLHPKLIAILIGTNNVDACTDTQIAEGITAVVRSYQKLCPSAVILLQGIFPRAESPTDPAREKLKRVNQIIASLGDGNRVVYVDFGDKFLHPDGTINRDLLPDALHPNAKGYEVWAESIRPEIVKVLGPAASVR